jgi:hypothetical protein
VCPYTLNIHRLLEQPACWGHAGDTKTTTVLWCKRHAVYSIIIGLHTTRPLCAADIGPGQQTVDLQVSLCRFRFTHAQCLGSMSLGLHATYISTAAVAGHNEYKASMILLIGKGKGEGRPASATRLATRRSSDIMRNLEASCTVTLQYAAIQQLAQDLQST